MVAWCGPKGGEQGKVERGQRELRSGDSVFVSQLCDDVCVCVCDSVCHNCVMMCVCVCVCLGTAHVTRHMVKRQPSVVVEHRYQMLGVLINCVFVRFSR